MRRLIIYCSSILAVLVLLSLTQPSAQSQKQDTWTPFHFLMGTWTGAGSGKPGHTINHTITIPSGQPSAIFESEADQKAPRYRLVYGITNDGILSIEFFIAPPGGDFKSYVKGTAKRKS